jgi:hypothetical protein
MGVLTSFDSQQCNVVSRGHFFWPVKVIPYFPPLICGAAFRHLPLHLLSSQQMYLYTTKTMHRHFCRNILFVVKNKGEIALSGQRKMFPTLVRLWYSNIGRILRI